MAHIFSKIAGVIYCQSLIPADICQKEAQQAAIDNGFKPAKDFKFNSKGQKVYEKGNTQITRDTEGHNGGVWKAFDKWTGERTGTLDKNFNRIKG